MANQEFSGRLVLDTAEVVKAAGNKLRITSVHFVGAADLDDCILHDGNGKEIIRFKLGTVATNGCNASHVFGGQGIVVDGLDLDTIDNGLLFVYLGRI